MALEHKYSVVGGLATAAVVVAVYQTHLPSSADARSLLPNADLSASERTATWTAAGVVAGVSLIAKDPTIFIIGGATVIALAWSHRHANNVMPNTAQAAATAAPRVVQSAPNTQAPNFATASYGTTF